MSSISLTQSLRNQYETLFNSCVIRPERISGVERKLAVILANQSRYESVSASMGIPWFFISVIHNMESSLNFNKHLHNGDSLSKRTTHVPAGRPKSGNPPFSWEESVADALALKNLGAHIDWSLAGILYQIERYNGWGYRLYHPHVLSPYLWGASNHYTSGKYVADGRWSDTAVSRQIGAAVLLHRMVKKNIIHISTTI